MKPHVTILTAYVALPHQRWRNPATTTENKKEVQQTNGQPDHVFFLEKRRLNGSKI
jgi:hypothetical protein